jgi:phosphoserine aminotransferase
MSKISFYPGPSRIYSNVTEYIYEAYKDGILSVNHRSEEFMDLSRKVKSQLKLKLDIPSDYKIFFVSSATESWEIIGQSLVEKKVQSFYNGAFGEKWSNYTKMLGKEVLETKFDIQEELPVEKLSKEAEWFFVTQTETSNGSMVSTKTLKKIKGSASISQLIAVDATSSLGGIYLDFSLADIWFASVQKCLGLPSGMGIMIASPQAIERAKRIGESNHYNSFLNVVDNHQKEQTHYTPNILLIYLLFRTMNISKGIEYIDDKITSRYKSWTSFMESFDSFQWLIKDPKLRSKTVLTLKSEDVENIKKLAYKADFIIGNGYGPWKNDTIRLANFPAIKTKEIEKFTKFLTKNFD